MTITLSRRTALAGLGLLCSTTALAACSGGASGDRLKVVIISKSYQNQFYQAAFKGAKDAADKLSVDLETNGPDAESNVSQQVEQLAAAVNQHPDAIALAASQPDAVQDAGVGAEIGLGVVGEVRRRLRTGDQAGHGHVPVLVVQGGHQAAHGGHSVEHRAPVLARVQGVVQDVQAHVRLDEAAQGRGQGRDADPPVG